LLPGKYTLTEYIPLPDTKLVIIGVAGGPYGAIIPVDAAKVDVEKSPVPFTFTAAILNWYTVAVITPVGLVTGDINPEIVTGLVVPATVAKGVVDHGDHVMPPSVEEADKYTYDVIADPLVDVGAVKFIVAAAIPPAAVVIVGANGVDTCTVDDTAAIDSPAAFTAYSLN